MRRNKPSTPKLVFRGPKRYHVLPRPRSRPKYKRPKLVSVGHKRFDVFLSFRGKDVRKTLVDHLYRALTAAGLTVFLDNVELIKGQKLGESFEEAINRSAICIPIFSKCYASSPWCLREASAMLRAPGLTIPLFYHMEPTHVRFPLSRSSPYKKYFRKHERQSDRYRRGEVGEWKNALGELCQRSGFSTAVTYGLEGKLVGRIVKELVKKCGRVQLEVAKYPVGMKKLRRALIPKLNRPREEVVKLGLWGMIGIGKTTAAKYLYNQIQGSFEHVCFVENVSANAVLDLPQLQKRILKQLVCYDGEVTNKYQGTTLFRNLLKRKKVLLILDDVNTEVDQLDALVGNSLGAGSIVIITSTDQQILKVLCQCIYEISPLDPSKGLKLFNKHASRSPGSSSFIERDEIQQMAYRIVEACEGHPYALVKMGYSMSGKTDDLLWIEASQNIRGNEDIRSRLSTSYMALPDQHKEIFRDIACFFNGEHKHLPILFWKSLPELSDMVATAVDNLVNKALLKIDDGGVFRMHYLFREMGRFFSEQSDRPTLLWNAARLRTPFSLKEFSRVQLNESNLLKYQVFCTDHLRYLHMEKQTIELTMLPTRLIWVRLEGCQFRIGTNTTAKKPRHSQFKKNTYQWKILQLKACSDSDSPSLSSPFSLPIMQLQHLDLEDCESLYNLPHVIGSLSQLEHLGLRGCKNLSSLHSIDKLSKLKTLDLRNCPLSSSTGNLFNQVQVLT